MDEKTIRMFFRLIGSAIGGDELSNKEKESYSAEMLSPMLKAAKQHDILHLLVLGLKNNNLLDGDSQNLETVLFKAVYRYEQINYDFTRLCDALEKAQIPFIPLKGSVIRSYYPEPWMRTSCDIDVLVHEADLETAVDSLVGTLGYTYKHKFTHDVSLVTPNGVHVELHYSLMEDEPVKSSFLVLNHAWDTAVRSQGHDYWYELSDEVFYFYHIAHMAKHFENGGCGIRPFVDLRILNRQIRFDGTKRIQLLERGDLLLFANLLLLHKYKCI